MEISNSMTNDERVALRAFAADMSTAFAKLAAAFGGPVTGQVVTPPLFPPASMQMPWQERVLRQSLILHEIKERGGSVPQTTWYEIANRYGYFGRGLAGFFRSNAQGLLELRGNKVFITKRGKERLAQNQERVATALLALETAAATVA